MHVCAWGGLHPELERRGPWAGHPGLLPIIDGTVIDGTVINGTVINVEVEHLPGERSPNRCGCGAATLMPPARICTGLAIHGETWQPNSPEACSRRRPRLPILR